MNVYDFDKTIYDGDSTVDFYRYCFRKYPHLTFCVPEQMWGLFRYMMGTIDTARFKECLFCFLPKIPFQDKLVETFWDIQQEKIKAWYLAQRRSDDLIISASPSFLLAPICERLRIKPPIATLMNPATGKIEGQNCKGEEKWRRFLEVYHPEEIESFYSDSLSDTPLARNAPKAFLVKRNLIQEWRS